MVLLSVWWAPFIVTLSTTVRRHLFSSSFTSSSLSVCFVFRLSRVLFKQEVRVCLCLCRSCKMEVSRIITERCFHERFLSCHRHRLADPSTLVIVFACVLFVCLLACFVSCTCCSRYIDSRYPIQVIVLDKTTECIPYTMCFVLLWHSPHRLSFLGLFVPFLSSFPLPFFYFSLSILFSFHQCLSFPNLTFFPK